MPVEKNVSDAASDMGMLIFFDFDFAAAYGLFSII